MDTTLQPDLHSRYRDEVFYVESSLPPGMTVGEYRRTRPRRPTRWERLKRLAGGPTVVSAHRA